MEAVTVAVISLLGGILATIIGGLVGIIAYIRKLAKKERLYWLYIKKLIDFIYRNDLEPPEVPEELIGEF